MATLTVEVPDRIKEELRKRVTADVSVTSQVIDALEKYLNAVPQ